MHQQQGGLDVRLHSAQSLAAWMTFRDISVRDLALRTGVSRSTIGHLRSGRRSTCSPALAKRIAKVLDVPVSALFAPRALRVARKPASASSRKAVA